MKKYFCLLGILATMIFISCNSNPKNESQTTANEVAVPSGGQEAVQDDVSQKDIVKVAVGSPDHTTLVAALKQAEYVDDISNAGPFTVFAPTNEAFAKLPAGTVEGLMKPDQKSALQNILEYHVAVGGYKSEMLQDGQTIGMANGDNITVSFKGDKMMVNGTANVIASVPASNGIIHIIDAVLLPPAKKLYLSVILIKSQILILKFYHA
jgi:uncharacterized surface protein with fasciclin (FAS1) repeats